MPANVEKYRDKPTYDGMLTLCRHNDDEMSRFRHHYADKIRFSRLTLDERTSRTNWQAN